MSSNVISLAPAARAYTGQQLDLIRTTVAKDCNQSEFDLFVTVANKVGLDPFRKQISAIVFNKNDEEKRRMAIITGIDGLRSIAFRSNRYRPDEEEAVYSYDESLKGPANPLGLEKAVVRIWIADVAREGGWRPVAGVAYWSEFAPLKEESSTGWDWVETGETWKDSGRPKMRRQPRAGGEIVQKLDTSGQWGKMPRLMLAKCAEAQALRKAFPEDLSSLYEEAEFDQARAIDLSPSEIIEQHRSEDRLLRIGAANTITLQFSPRDPLEQVPLGQVADRTLAAAWGFTSVAHLDWFESANSQPLREFWARAKADALALKQELVKRRGELQDSDAELVGEVGGGA